MRGHRSRAGALPRGCFGRAAALVAHLLVQPLQLVAMHLHPAMVPLGLVALGVGLGEGEGAGAGAGAGAGEGEG